MHKTLSFKLQTPIQTTPSHFFNFHQKMSIFVPKSLHFSTPYSLLTTNSNTHLNSTTTHIKNPIVSARRKKSFPLFGSAKSRKLFVSAYYIASKLKILPEPLDFVIREYAVGNGGGGGGGGGGFRWNWGGFGGWGRRGRKLNNWKLWGCFVILGVLLRLVLLNFGKELEIGEVWGVLGLSLFGASLNGWFVRGVKDWALGFCCCVVLFVSVSKGSEIQTLVKDYLPMKIVGKRRRKSGNLQVMIQNICRKMSLN